MGIRLREKLMTTGLVGRVRLVGGRKWETSLFFWLFYGFAVIRPSENFSVTVKQNLLFAVQVQPTMFYPYSVVLFQKESLSLVCLGQTKLNEHIKKIVTNFIIIFPASQKKLKNHL